ncbi:alcohol dehydrogenase YqhD (iron-dependent ADH family) [Enterococcus sp. PF1-24]|uniref:iron-containing alcohol dehydrogenase n=1 Tax=unclassified Enterococcus TaxID=2608891 RepID=UPI0024765523|nr:MULTISPECIES: iron-containing alcohol dehydrogenase [unclassified Enterococcus]MDH6363868.1 alcohol dehydrogenase YqhD (iron-dependent ADH family) [Enterococcus sp. PFB1-1]MDH6400946.1 alcohol dehydrogenase YqhD (iron-dependent ADH family) [Enterococcus sp. PF1-24]
MDNFRFCVGTDIRFGKERLAELPEVLAEYGKKVLLVYGGGSIKKNGLYDKIQRLLKDFEIVELAGVEPNPRLTTVKKGAALCREQQIDVILAVGGGSTVDCSKVIAAATFYEGDPWEFIKDRQYVGKALPLVDILTLAATGSEMNRGAVISNWDTNEKIGVGGWEMLPKVSFLDPENTFTVSKYQTAAGSADILSHLFENYFKNTEGTDVQDFVAEGLMKTVIKNCPIALVEPNNYDARANLMWASTLALNGLTGSGKGGAWSCHPIEHELSAYYDITHGIGLAILTPRWLKYVLNEKTATKIAQYARNVWQVTESVDELAARIGIQKTYDYFKACGIPMTLPEVGIDEEKFELMAQQAVKHSDIENSAYVPMTAADVVGILQDCLIESSYL